MSRWTAPLAASLLLLAIASVPPASAGPCDNEIEEILCAALAAVDDVSDPCDPMVLDFLCTIWMSLQRAVDLVCSLTTVCPVIEVRTVLP